MRFLIAGAFSRSLPIIKFLSTGLLDGHEVVVYDGINSCRWNGGRINRPIEYNTGLMDYYYNRGIGIALTLSNPEIDLADETGNHLLEKFHKSGNSLIIVNDELRQYVRDRYPLYKLIYSITGQGLLSIPLDDVGVEWYRDLESKYDWIVPKFEHVFDARAGEVDRSKWEVMVNDTCVWSCKHYDEHFKAIAKENWAGRQISSENRAVEECWLPKFNPDIDSKYDCMDIKTGNMERLISSGVGSFKIMGRELDDETYYGELSRFAERALTALENIRG